MKYRKKDNNPLLIVAKFDSICSETKKPIKKGDDILYYPLTKSVYSLDSKQYSEFKEVQFDSQVLGYDY